MSEHWKEFVSRVEWHSLLLVFLFGSGGGLCYWFYMLYDAHLSGAVADSFIWTWLIVLPAVLMLGGFTALVGVYYITGNKPDEITKAMVLSLVFGFSFNSVLQYLNESHSRALNLEQAENSTAELTRENAELRAELQNRDAPTNPALRIEELVRFKTREAGQLIDALRDSRTRSARDKFSTYARELIVDLEKSAIESPATLSQEPIRGLGEIGAQAVKSGEDISLQAIESVNNVALTRLQANTGGSQDDIRTYLSADQALAEIARAARMEKRSSVAERVQETRLDLARKLVQSERIDAMSATQKTQLRSHLMSLDFTDEARKQQLQQILEKLDGPQPLIPPAQPGG
jgi:hypothetical protein